MLSLWVQNATSRQCVHILHYISVQFIKMGLSHSQIIFETAPPLFLESDFLPALPGRDNRSPCLQRQLMDCSHYLSPVPRQTRRLSLYYYGSSGAFFASQPRKIPPLKTEAMIKKISANKMKIKDGSIMRVYFLPHPAPLRMLRPMRMR